MPTPRSEPGADAGWLAPYLPTRAELRRAAWRGGLFAAALAVLSGLSGAEGIGVGPGALNLVLCAYLGLLVAAVTWLEGLSTRRQHHPLASAFRVAVLALSGALLAWFQVVYAANLIELGSPGAALASVLDLLGSRRLARAVFFFGAIAVPLPLLAFLRLVRAARLTKALAGGGLSLVGLYTIAVVLVPNLGAGGRTGELSAFAGLAHGLGLLPALAIPFLDPTCRLSPPAGRPSSRRTALRVLGGLVLPCVCFGLNELMGGQGPEWRAPGLETWWRLASEPEPQRPLYPLLVAAMVAYGAHLQGRRGPWVAAGLVLGVVLGALFTLVYLGQLPLALVGILVFGVGLLGLAPYPVFCLYLAALLRERERVARALVRDLAEAHEAESTSPRPGRGAEGVNPSPTWGGARPEAVERVDPEPWAVVPVVAVSVGFGVALWRAGVELNTLYLALPTEPPDCYLATVAARGDARLTGARPVRFPGGAVRPISDQLRTFKAGELVLAALAPRLHRGLRAGYDRWGPGLAGRLGARGATLAFLLLQPLAGLTALGLRLVLEDPDALRARIYAEAA